MLSTLIGWTTTFNFEREVRLDVGRVNGGAVADYKARLIDERSGEELAAVELKRYVRWSEPVTGLIARALHYCVSDGTPSHLVGVHSVRTLQLKIGLIPGGRGERRELVRLTADFRNMQAPVMWTDEEHGGERETRDLHFGTQDPLSLALQVMSQWLWGASMPSGDPAPLKVPVYRAGAVDYVRFSDIPEPARRAFSKRMDGATVPAIAGETDIAYAHDWQMFLER